MALLILSYYGTIKQIVVVCLHGCSVAYAWAIPNNISVSCFFSRFAAACTRLVLYGFAASLNLSILLANRRLPKGL
jgi:hypothetical protein